MPKNINFRIAAKDYEDGANLQEKIAKYLGISSLEIQAFTVEKKSLDARGKTQVFQLQILVWMLGEEAAQVDVLPALQDVTNAKHEVVIIGAGPAGIFAALRCLELGMRPVIFERGKPVRARRRDLAMMNKEGVVNGDSNYCYGEGGAGTYSDGKLYTRSNKRGDVKYILQRLVAFGANPNILYEAHPHIGTNKLPKIIEACREAIEAAGGVYHFESKLEGLVIKDEKIVAVEVGNIGRYPCENLVLATGHSARDVYQLLDSSGVLLEAKPFAIGVRIEHPQALIDTVQYGGRAHANTYQRPAYLEPASYALVSKKQQRSVFSFCMCPGGIIAPAATSTGEIVVNGWSPSKRNNPFANSGLVVAVDEKDYSREKFFGPLGGMWYQQKIEQACYEVVRNGLQAPAMRATDFVNGKLGPGVLNSSYPPGIIATDLHTVLPKEISEALRSALQEFNQKMPGYISEDAVMVATESRTSSPVRIPRDAMHLHHVQIKNLYPCAEGAGYAGGIVSAAIDGMRCVEAIGNMWDVGSES